ncbi:CHAD domain-containing protein [Silvibacterium acidisoli]|uniref:CHAD domain-containing protein n=1 Tax=Acidobacteriaceae bacterium ZG23-2 TaxID=2883246 RepID=UPI00406BF8A7
MPRLQAVNPETATLRALVVALEETLAVCASDPGVDAIHRTRTGTRRIEAQLDALVRTRQTAGEEHQEFGEAVAKLRKLLKKIRRAAAPARDLDVHRKLLEKLTEEPEGKAPEAIGEPVEKLDHWLKHGREHHARRLQKLAAKWAGKLEQNLVLLEASFPRAKDRRAPDPARSALDAFAVLSTHMQRLDAANLHDFRKGAKKARYMAESGGEHGHAAAIGRALKKMQDEIGDWHDWLTLAEEAQSVLEEDGLQLKARLEEQRDSHYAEAMRISERMRGRLMGEWQSMKPVRRRKAPASH